MARFGLIALALTLVGGLTFATMSPTEAIAGKACSRKTFETKMVADACKVDQGEAKKAMKAFLKTAKKKESGLDCQSCHSKLAPSYPLKDGALEHFKKLGGE